MNTKTGTAIDAAVKYQMEQTQIKPKVLMSCTLCTYKTTYLTKKMAKKRLYNHQRRNHPRDSNNNPKEDKHDVPDWVTKEEAQRNHGKKVPCPHVPDTASMEDSGDDSCMAVHGDEEWVRDMRR